MVNTKVWSMITPPWEADGAEAALPQTTAEVETSAEEAEEA
jgi:hypothetical protein